MLDRLPLGVTPKIPFSLWLLRLWIRIYLANLPTVESAMNRNSPHLREHIFTIIYACTIFPIYLQNYSDAINLPITLKALSITDVSHASRRSANSLNRCPMQYVIGFFKGQDKAPTYFPTCFTLFGFNRKARILFGWAIHTKLPFQKVSQTSKYYIFQPFATVPQNQLMHIPPTNFFLCNAPLSGISWALSFATQDRSSNV